MTPDVNVILLNLPTKEKEAVTENEDGTFTIVINSKLSYDGQLLAYKHAMKHINNCDFQNENVQSIEVAAHAMPISEISEGVERIPSERFLRRIQVLRAERKRIQEKLRKIESELEVTRSMEPWDGLTVSSNQSWFGGNQ